jgi:integrase
MSFLHIYTINGIRKSIVLGHYPQMALSAARAKHRDVLSMLESGEDPREEAQQERAMPVIPEDPFTVKKLISEYCAWAEKNNECKEGIRTINKHILHAWGDRLPETIRRKEAIALVEEAISTPGQARNIKKYGSALFNYAIDREIVELNPFANLTRTLPALAHRPKTRYLSDQEIVLLWNTTEFTRLVKFALLLVLVTGQRPGEVIAIHERELETLLSGEKWWTIPASRIKTRKKNFIDHRVPLSPLAVRLLDQLSPIEGYFFPGKNGAMLEPALSHAVWTNKIDPKDSKEVNPGHLGIPAWTPHDLRRTARTLLSKLRAPEEVKKAILNHAKTGMDAVYDQYRYDDEKREWLNKLGKYIEEVVGTDAIPKSTDEGKLRNVTSEELRNLVWRYPLVKIGEMFGVSEAAVRKRCDKDVIDRPTKGYWLRIVNSKE